MTSAQNRIDQPYGIRLATARSTEPVRRYATFDAAVANAKVISAGQGGATWLVSGPTGNLHHRPLRLLTDA